MKTNIELSFNIRKISTTLLTLYVLTASLYVAVFNSLLAQIMILCIIIMLLVTHLLLTKSNLLIKRTDALFMLSIIALMFSLHDNVLITANIAGPIIFMLLIIISILIRGEAENFIPGLKLIKWGGIFYALSVLLNFISPSIYEKVYLSILRSNVADNIRASIEGGYYTGFTGQVGYTAGYIAFSLGIIGVGLMVDKKEHSRRILRSSSILIVLIIGLLLTQKRAHLVIMAVSLMLIFITYSQNNTEKIKKVIKGFVLSLLVLFIVISLSNYTEIGRILFARILESFNDIAEGQDITSNRTNLWIHAWNVFLQNPLFGIGWGNFNDSIIGAVTVYTKMDTHNIYLQLLSETGIIGTTLILLPLFSTYAYTLKVARTIKSNNVPRNYQVIVLYSFYIQTFTLLYGLTGNPLYDYTFLSMYLLSIGMIYSYWQYNLKIKKSYIKNRKLK